MADEPVQLDHHFLQNPHDNFARCRALAPVVPAVQGKFLRGWLVTGYKDIRALLTDPRVSKDYTGGLALHPPEASAGLAPTMHDHMLHADPPRHTRLRKLVGKVFTARAVAQLKPKIEQITEQLLDDMAGTVTVDLMEAFAFPLPITVICELLGIPFSDRAEFQAWTKVIMSSVQPAEAHAVSRAMTAYLDRLIDSKRIDPGSDLLSDLVHVSNEGDQLNQAELAGMALLLLAAGFDTTAHAIGNSVIALLHHPEQLKALRANPSLLPAAVEELLRFDGVINIGTLRFTTEPVQLDDVEIPAGQFVWLSLLAANRDSDRFPEPDQLEIHRPANGHLGFGHGIHHCLGAPLARLELQIALGRLFDRYPNLTLLDNATNLRWRHSTLIHGVDQLPIQLR